MPDLQAFVEVVTSGGSNIVLAACLWACWRMLQDQIKGRAEDAKSIMAISVALQKLADRLDDRR